MEPFERHQISLIIFTYFDPACWEYEGVQDKIVVNYPRNELKLVWRLPFLLTWNRNTTEFGVLLGFKQVNDWLRCNECTLHKASCCSSEHKQFRGFLAPNSFGRFFTLNFCLILSRLHCIFCEDIYDHWISVSGAAVYERITDEVLQSLRPGGGRPSQTREGRQFRSAILIFNKE